MHAHTCSRRPVVVGPLIAGALLLLSHATGLPGTAFAQGVNIHQVEIIELSTGKVLNPTDLTRYFNKARCECAAQTEVVVRFATLPTGSSDYLVVVAGQNCLEASTGYLKDPARYPTACKQLFGPVRANTLISNIDLYNLTSRDLMGDSCSDVDAQTYGVYVYTSSTSEYDSLWSEVGKINYTVDTKPPASPTADAHTGAQAGEGLVDVTFGTAATGAATDAGSGVKDTSIKGYQILCEKLDPSGSSIGPGLLSPPSPEYQAAFNLCGSPPPISEADAGPQDLGAADLVTPDSAPPADAGVPFDGAVDLTPGADARPPDSWVASDVGGGGLADGSTSGTGIFALDQRYVCSSRQTGAGTVRITGLENGVTYRFFAIAIDLVGNPSHPAELGSATPSQEEDLWERYKRSGGQADGSYCFVATAACGSEDHVQVRTLRAFRDKVLFRSELGRLMVGNYYASSPPVARWLERHPAARPVVRAALWPATAVAAVCVATTPPQRGVLLVFCGFGLILLAWRLERREGERRAIAGRGRPDYDSPSARGGCR